jgi:hypothetical protein
MKRWIPIILIATTSLTARGCISPSPSTTTVRLVNNAGFPVTVKLVYGPDQNVLQEILEATGNVLDFTLQPGTSDSFSRDCSGLQAVEIQRADLSIIGGIGPSSGTRVYRDGSDFFCGNTITFTFTQSITATELNISFNQQG